MPQCSRGCRKPVHARGLCNRCYQRFWQGTLDCDEPPRRTKQRGRCSIGDCGAERYGRGMCRTHWMRWYRGDRGARLRRPLRAGPANLPVRRIDAARPKPVPPAPRHNPYRLLKPSRIPAWAREMAS